MTIGPANEFFRAVQLTLSIGRNIVCPMGDAARVKRGSDLSPGRWIRSWSEAKAEGTASQLHRALWSNQRPMLMRSEFEFSKSESMRKPILVEETQKSLVH